MNRELRAHLHRADAQARQSKQRRRATDRDKRMARIFLIAFVASLAFLIAVRAAAEQVPVPCDPSPNSQTCVPPATWFQSASPLPYRVSVRYGGPEVNAIGRVTHWKWIKAEDGPPCSAQERASYGKDCDIKVGEVLFMNNPFVMREQRLTRLAKD